MPDVTIAGDDPVIDQFAIEGRPSGGGSSKEGIRIGKVFGAQWVEANGRLLSFGSRDRIHCIPQAIPRGPSLARRRDNHTAKVRISLRTTLPNHNFKRE